MHAGARVLDQLAGRKSPDISHDFPWVPLVPCVPCLLDGPIDAESFRAWEEQFLVPTLRPTDIVVMDNLSSHKRPPIRQAIRSAGAKLFYLQNTAPT